MKLYKTPTPPVLRLVLALAARSAGDTVDDGVDAMQLYKGLVLIENTEGSQNPPFFKFQ